MGRGRLEFPEQVNQPHEAGLLSLDITKAQTVLGWKPKMNARKALDMTLRWYKAYYQGDDMKIFTNNQIEEYLNN